MNRHALIPHFILGVLFLALTATCAAGFYLVYSNHLAASSPTSTSSATQEPLPNSNAAQTPQTKSSAPAQMHPVSDAPSSDSKNYHALSAALDFTYPTDWNVVEDSNLIKSLTLIPSASQKAYDERSSDIEKLNLRIEKNPQHLSARQIFETYDDTSRLWPQQFPTKTVQFNSWQGLEINTIPNGEALESILVLTDKDTVVTLNHICPNELKTCSLQPVDLEQLAQTLSLE